MSYQDPNQGQHPNPSSGQYGGGYGGPTPQPTDPYSGQQYGNNPSSGGYGQPQQPYGQPQEPYNQQQPYGQPQQPYGQQQYGSQAPYGAAPGIGSQGATSMGLEQNVASGLAYAFTWVSGLVIFLVEKQNRFVRFHAMQSILTFGGLALVSLLATILSTIFSGSGVYFMSTAFGCVSWLVGLAMFALWIVCMIQGFQNKYFKLPIVGDYAERYVDRFKV